MNQLSRTATSPLEKVKRQQPEGRRSLLGEIYLLAAAGLFLAMLLSAVRP